MKPIKTDSGLALQPFLLTAPRSVEDVRKLDDLKRYIAARMEWVASVAQAEPDMVERARKAGL